MQNAPRPKRDVDGFLLLDKPLGVSSNHALQRVKHLFQARKAGHTGSLDPLATGLLPICLGQAAKFSQYLLDADKEYEVSAGLGARSSTGDLEGELTPGEAVAVDSTQLAAACMALSGPLLQVPPMYSALKHQGRPLYELARQGKTVARKPRQITIHEFVLLGGDAATPRFRVRCSKGTYIRTLIEDLGNTLGCGAHVTALRRIGMTPFGRPEMVTLDALQDCPDSRAMDACLLPMDRAVTHLPALYVDADGLVELGYGRRAAAERIRRAETGGDPLGEGCLVRLYGADRRFLGMGRMLDNGGVKPERLLREVSIQSPGRSTP